MKSRQEMIYEFMLALAPNAYNWQEELLEMNGEVSPDDVASVSMDYAVALTNVYLEYIC